MAFPTNADTLATDKTDGIFSASDHPANHNAVNTAVNAVEAYLIAAPRHGFSLLVAANDSPAAWKAKADFVCDGTGDQVELAAAATALPAIGGTIYLAPGGYVLNAAWTLTKPITLKGSGRRATTIALANGVNDYAIKIDAQSGSEGRDFWVFEDFTVFGNSVNQTAGGCILAGGCVQSTFRDLRINGPHTNGLYLTSSTAITFGHHNRVENCLFDGGDQSPGNGCGLRVGASDENFISKCDFENNGGAAGAQEDTAQVKLEVGLNTVVHCVFVNGRAGIASHDCNDNRIIGCVFDGSNGDQVRISGSRVVVMGCSFTSCGSNSANNLYSPIRVAFGDDGNQIIGNFFASHTTASRTRSLIRFEGSGGQTNNVVSGNRFRVEGALGTALIEDSATNTRYRDNIGYVTHASGTFSYTTGATTRTVTHGLAGTPARVVLTPTGDPGTARFWVSAKSATTFTITCSVSTQACTFDWAAWLTEFP
jgi:hypothetical protein